MLTLEDLNNLRSREKWQEIAEEARKHIQESVDAFVLRGLAQALDKLDQRNEEYESTLLQLLELKDRTSDTAHKLSQYYQEKNDEEEAIRHLQIAVESCVEEEQFDLLDEYWNELLTLIPEELPFFIRNAKAVSENHSHKAAQLLHTLVSVCEEQEEWHTQYEVLDLILQLTPEDQSLREPFIKCLQNLYSDSDKLKEIFEFTHVEQAGKNLSDALQETERFARFIPGNYVMHPDWGVGKVKNLSMKNRRVQINFQKKKDHKMSLDLADSAVQHLEKDDIRVLSVVDRDNLMNTSKEDPVAFIKILLKSFGGSMNTKDMKEYVVPRLMSMRQWTSWWSNANSLARKDPHISVSGGVTKQFTLHKRAVSDEDDLLLKFDETRTVHDKVDQIYGYLRNTKKDDVQIKVIHHFTQKIHAIAPTRKSPLEIVELWFTNEDLKKFDVAVESLPDELLYQTLENVEQAERILPDLRTKSHQWRYAKRIKEVHNENWTEIFKQLILHPSIDIRDELAKELEKAGATHVIDDIVDTALNDFRQYSYLFIWISGKALTRANNWLQDKISTAIILDRLLLLVDYLSSQAKRRDKDEALWLRKVASAARDIIRRGNYSIFKESLNEVDEPNAQSIYRRAAANEGLDSRTSSDLTMLVRARFPTLLVSKEDEEAIGPQGVLCLPRSLTIKKELIKRLVEVDMPQVVQEIETARQHGDLRENAEYHAAKDKQKLLASQVAELQESLSSPQAIYLENVEPDEIQFGTEFKVQPAASDVTEEYIMLGPWESDPDHNILSYQAPFAQFFLGKKVGDFVDVELPMHTGRYEVQEINVLTPERIDDLNIFERVAQLDINLDSDLDAVSETALLDAAISTEHKKEPTALEETKPPAEPASEQGGETMQPEDETVSQGVSSTSYRLD